MESFADLGIDEMMEMKVPFTKLVDHVKTKCKSKLQGEKSNECLKCVFLPWVLIIMDVHNWKYKGDFK